MHQLKIVTRLMLAAAIVLTIGCDRVTKHFAAETMAGAPERTYLGDTLRLAYVENSGGFLGLGSDLAPTVRTQVFTVGTGVLLLALIAAAFKLPWHPWSLLGIAFFVAGGASNWIDRVVRGSVVDFLNIGIGPLRTGIFNFADVAIMVGFGLILVGELWKSESADQPG
jgi:signal peptidase II